MGCHPWQGLPFIPIGLAPGTGKRLDSRATTLPSQTLLVSILFVQLNKNLFPAEKFFESLNGL